MEGHHRHHRHHHEHHTIWNVIVNHYGMSSSPPFLITIVVILPKLRRQVPRGLSGRQVKHQIRPDLATTGKPTNTFLEIFQLTLGKPSIVKKKIFCETTS